MAHPEPTSPLGPAADAAFAVLWDFLVVVDPPQPCDAIFCFGSRSRSVPATAAALFAQGVAPRIVVTGGGPMAEHRCEADAFADALERRGVPAEAIVIERHARHTGENVELGLAALGGVVEPTRLAAVSWALGMRRAVATFGGHRPDLDVLAAPAFPDDRPRWDATPGNIADALGEWDRLDAYAVHGHIAPQPRPADVVDAARILRSELRSAGAPAAPRPGARLLRSGPRGVPAPATLPG